MPTITQVSEVLIRHASLHLREALHTVPDLEKVKAYVRKHCNYPMELPEITREAEKDFFPGSYVSDTKEHVDKQLRLDD